MNEELCNLWLRSEARSKLMTETPQTLLVRLCRQPEEQDWQRFVQLFTPLLSRWVRRFDVAESDTEDLLQELYLLLWKHLPTFSYDSSKSFHAWLWTVTRRFSRDWLQRTKHLVSLDYAGQLPTRDELTPEDEKEFARELVHRGLALIQADFTPTTWAVFQGIALEQQPAKDLAQQYGLSTNAVYLAYSRVLHRLRTEVMGFLDKI